MSKSDPYAPPDRPRRPKAELQTEDQPPGSQDDTGGEVVNQDVQPTTEAVEPTSGEAVEAGDAPEVTTGEAEEARTAESESGGEGESEGESGSDEGDGYDDMTKEDLSDELRERGLPHTGNKGDLVERLREDDAADNDE